MEPHLGPLVADVPALTSARVTLDVLHSGVIWGWLVTMNMWAKSVATGAVLVGVFLMRRFPGERRTYRLWLALLGFVFVSLTLLFTVLDLHQPLRFWHMFVWPHFTSAINVGAWLLTAFSGLLALMLLAAWRRMEALMDALVTPTAVLAFFATIYTAALMGQASAREIWSTPTEVAQTLLAATLCGGAVFLIVGPSGAPERSAAAWILGLSAAVSLTIFVTEIVFAPMKSEEADYVIHQLVSGRLGATFATGLVLAFVAPPVLAALGLRSRGGGALLRVAAALSLVGLWLVKHAWLLAPQHLPLS